MGNESKMTPAADRAKELDEALLAVRGVVPTGGRQDKAMAVQVADTEERQRLITSALEQYAAEARLEALEEARLVCHEAASDYHEAWNEGGGKAALDMECGALTCEERVNALAKQESWKVQHVDMAIHNVPNASLRMGLLKTNWRNGSHHSSES